MGKLNLQGALLRLRPFPEDFENQSGPVDNLDFPVALQVALLYGRHRPVDDHDINMRVFDEITQLVNLAGSEQCARPRLVQSDNLGMNNIKGNGSRERDGFFEATLRITNLGLG